MKQYDDNCEVVGCSNDRDTAVQIGDYGLPLELCDKHAEARVAEFEEIHYADE